MKKIHFYILISIFMAIFMPVFANPKDFKCSVIYVHDGDTFTCKDGMKIRVWGIDTPEVPPKVKKAQPGGIEAKYFLTKMILNKDLSCTLKGKSYKRTVALCTFNGQDIAKELINKKLAKEKTKYSKGYYHTN